MRATIVAPQPMAVEEGAKVLRRGGNAVDAAVTCAFVEMVVDPQMGGIGGYGMIHVYWRETGERFLLDFQTKAPAAASETMFSPEERPARGGFFWTRNNENEMGYKSVGVPGVLKGLHETLERFGAISWKDALAPAIDIARRGFPVHEDLYRYWIKPPRDGNVDQMTRFGASVEGARLFLNGGRFYRPGETLVLADYADTLEIIANEGPEAFYRGEIAERIEEDFRKNGGILTRKDLEDYRTTESRPLAATYRGHEVHTSPYPGAGTFLLLMLNLLEGFGLGELGPDSPDCLHLLARAQDIAFAERAKVWGDPRFSDLPVEKLISKRFAEDCRAKMNEGAPRPAPRRSREDGNTTHVSVVDARGNTVALTHSLGSSSGVVVPGLGFLFNNGLCRFDPRPGRPNSLAPGKRRPSTNTPTIVYRGGEPVLVLGAAGGFGILTGVLQTLLNVIDHGMGILEAVSAPRIHSENNLIFAENRIPEETLARLRAMGHEVQRRPYSYDGGFGNVQAIHLDGERGTAAGASDPRRGGVALYA